MSFLSSVIARSGQLAHITLSIRTTFVNVPLFSTEGVTTSSCWQFFSSSMLAISCSTAWSCWKLSTSRQNAEQMLSTLFLSCWASRRASSASESFTKWNSSACRLRQQLAVMASAARCALIEKKSRNVRHDATPFACRMLLLWRRDRISSAVKLCSATSMHWITCNFSRKAGMASTTVPEERGRASSIPCSSCCAFDELLFAPIVRCSRWCIRGPSAPNRCGGRPRASSNACRRPTSLSSLSESGCAAGGAADDAVAEPDELEATPPPAAAVAAPPPDAWSMFTSTTPPEADAEDCAGTADPDEEEPPPPPPPPTTPSEAFFLLLLLLWRLAEIESVMMLDDGVTAGRGRSKYELFGSGARSCAVRYRGSRDNRWYRAGA
uniref:Uncharacterized protein n=1 Tax=Anopheles atroparvus TaxID=41427 RepID=A0A182J0Z3_ANOAO